MSLNTLRTVHDKEWLRAIKSWTSSDKISQVSYLAHSPFDIGNCTVEPAYMNRKIQKIASRILV